MINDMCIGSSDHIDLCVFIFMYITASENFCNNEYIDIRMLKWYFFNCFCWKLNNNNGRHSKISILLVRIKVFWCTFIPKGAFTCPLELILINYFLVSRRKSPIPKWRAATSEFWWFYFKVDDIIIGHVNAP
jgi:hypothetical protein